MRDTNAPANFSFLISPFKKSFSSTQENHDVIYQRSERTKGCRNVGIGCAVKGVYRHAVVALGGDSRALQPCRGSTAGVYLHGEGYEGEHCGAGKENNADEQQ